MSGSHVHAEDPGLDAVAAVGAAPQAGVLAPAMAFGALAAADEGTRVRALLRAQRGGGNALVACAVRKLMRAKYIQPAERTPEMNAFVKEQLDIQRAEAGRVKAKYTAAAKEDFAKAKEHFSAEALVEGVEVPAEMTPLTAEQVARALGYAWQKVFDKPIPQGALAILIGKWKTEGGEKGIANYNIGNLQYQGSKDKPPEDAPTDYSWRNPEEVDKSGARKKKAAWHQSFKSVEEGALGLLRWYATNDARAGVLGALLHGNNPRDYAYAAFGAGFFTAAPERIVWPATGDILEPGYLNLIGATMPKNDDLAVLMQEAGAGENRAWDEDVAKAEPEPEPAAAP
jgi:hypothetical protein